MKRFIDILKSITAIGAALIIYKTATEASEGGGDIVLYVVVSLFSVALVVSLFALSALLEKVSALEDAVDVYAESGYDDDDGIMKRECPVCRALIDADVSVCPYCGNKDETPDIEVFPTENADYRGTDFSNEELVSAHCSENDF